MNKILKNKNLIIILIIILLIILFSILFIINRNKNENNDIEIEQKENDDTAINMNDGDIIDEPFENTVYQLQNPGLAFEAYWAINRLKVSAYSEEAMLEILDDEYLNYYNLDNTNILDKMENYKGKEYNITNIEYMYYNSTYLCILTCDDGKKFVFKYSDYYKGYTILLDDYINDIGYDKFVNEKAEIILNEEFKGSQYTVLENIAYTDDEILSNYAMMIYDFDYVYENIIDDDTKNRYSYEQLYDIYYDDYSLFGANFSKVDFSKSLNENGLFTYTFKDLSENTYVLTENAYFDFSLNIS